MTLTFSCACLLLLCWTTVGTPFLTRAFHGFVLPWDTDLREWCLVSCHSVTKHLYILHLSLGQFFSSIFFFLTHMKIFEPCVVVVYTFNPSTWEAGSGRSWWVSGQPDLYILSSRPKLHGKAICKKKNNFFIVVVHIFPVPAIFGAHLKHWSTRRSVRGRYCLGRLGRKGQTCISALQHCCSPLPLLLCVYFLLC